MHDILLSPANPHIHPYIYNTYAIYLIKEVNIDIKYEQMRYYVLPGHRCHPLNPPLVCVSLANLCLPPAPYFSYQWRGNITIMYICID